VHVDLEDNFQYLREIHRILRDGGRATLHYASLTTEAGWAKFVEDQPQNLGQPKLYHRFRFLTREMVDQMTRSLGLKIIQAREGEGFRDLLVVVEKPAVAPSQESAAGQSSSAVTPDPSSR